jgi:hypothetical protein
METHDQYDCGVCADGPLAFDALTLEHIREHGCSVIGVAECFGTGTPALSYSVGLGQTAHAPEVCLTGLPPSVAHPLINRYRRRVLDGERFLPGPAYADFLEGYDVYLLPVKPSELHWLGQAGWFHHGWQFAAVQMIYPSREGLWPWDRHYPASMRRVQRLLCEARRP